MNSYNTNAETDRVKHKYERRVHLYTFNQSYYPRVNQETLRPIPEKPDYKDGELVYKYQCECCVYCMWNFVTVVIHIVLKI